MPMDKYYRGSLFWIVFQFTVLSQTGHRSTYSDLCDKIYEQEDAAEVFHTCCGCVGIPLVGSADASDVLPAENKAGICLSWDHYFGNDHFLYFLKIIYVLGNRSF